MPEPAKVEAGSTADLVVKQHSVGSKGGVRGDRKLLWMQQHSVRSVRRERQKSERRVVQQHSVAVGFKGGAV